ncbi:DUF3558 family protein [Amycolatopsis nigrescens]|uniref:DUF3558 family protein n=1 Tax=Amycolatopsis nigrescens TaxID=381445 RepID=UPI000A05B6E9|nr:DUF3558 family protein [Amycolatopsis nigrescens]
MKRPRDLTALLIIACGAALAACGSETPGNAAMTLPDASPLASTEPCTLAPPDTVSKLGGSGPGETEQLGEARTCVWQVPGLYVFSVDIYDRVGLDNISRRPDAKDITQVSVGSARHDAMSWTWASSCVYSVGTSPTSRIDFATTSGLPEKNCDTAKIMADAVEPNLPGQVK